MSRAETNDEEHMHGVLVFIDTFRTRCRCLLCPRERSIRITHDVAAHLEWDHRKTTREANRIVAALDRTSYTEGGDLLEEARVGHGLGLGAVREEEAENGPERQEGAEPEEEQQPKPLRAAIGESAVCPFCKTEFSRKVSVLRHLKKVHKLGPSEIKKHSASIKNIQSECKRCFKWVSDSGMTKHKRHCKGPEVEAVDETAEPASDVPKGFAKGGKLFYPIFKDYLRRSIKSVSQYVNKGMKVLEFFEKKYKDFKTDRLLYSLDTNTMMPALSTYLKRDEANDSDRKVATMAYKYICKVAVEEFETRYGSDERFSLQDKNAWKSDVMMKMKEYDAELKVIGKKLKTATTVKATAATIAKTNLTYNEKRMKEVARDVLNLPALNEVTEDLVNMSEVEILDKYDELYVRHALAVQALFSTGGKRPSTVANITLGELRSRGWFPRCSCPCSQDAGWRTITSKLH